MGGPGPDPDPHDPRPPGSFNYEPRYEIGVVDITENCNLSCLHCYNRKRSNKHLSLTEGKRIASILKSVGMKYAIFSGGEPLVHSRFFRLVDIFNRLGLPIIMRSNGQLIDPAVADKIAAKDFYFVGISMDGGTRHTNDLIRGQGAYDRAIKAITLLKERGLAVTIEVTLTSLSIPEITEIVKTAEQIAVDLVIFRRFIPLGHGGNNVKLCAPNKEVDDARKVIRDMSDRCNIRLEIGCNLGGVCLAYDYIAVDLEGWVHPCYMIRKPLFHITELEKQRREKFESFKGQNVHECLNFI